jgi:hypothetical protein
MGLQRKATNSGACCYLLCPEQFILFQASCKSPDCFESFIIVYGNIIIIIIVVVKNLTAFCEPIVQKCEILDGSVLQGYLQYDCYYYYC